FGAHPVDAWGTGVLLDASERLSEIPAGHEQLPQARRGGVRSGVARRRGWTLHWAMVFGLHRRTVPTRPLAGLAAFNVHPTSAGVLRLGFAFGPSRRQGSAGSTTSADFSTASSALANATVPSHPANTPSVTGHPGTPAE